jgi:hypothetical protein
MYEMPHFVLFLVRWSTTSSHTAQKLTNKSYTPKIHYSFITGFKNNINIFNALKLYVTKGSTSHLGKGRRPQVRHHCCRAYKLCNLTNASLAITIYTTGLTSCILH